MSAAPRVSFIHTVVLPPVVCAGHSLSFFCDLKRELALEELLATLDLWLDWNEHPAEVLEQHTSKQLTEDEAYDLASQSMRYRLTALQNEGFRQQCLQRVAAALTERRMFPDVLNAFNEYFGAADARPSQLDAPTPTRLH